ncbi:MAG: coproporphyrinogen-III oxidase family protein [bacterium]
MISLHQIKGLEFELKEPSEGNYFVSAYPPFSCWQKEYVTELKRELDAPPAAAGDRPFGLYVHIPFCVIRCMYCYYLSYAKKSPDDIDRYIAALIKELAMYHEKRNFENRHINFVYFGGGTPSILSVKQTHKLINTLKSLFPWTAVQEVTFECAPKTVTESKLLTLREAGVTRISLGVQQLNDEVLEKNGRVHLVRDVERAYSMIQRIGFEMVNVDLMVGLIGESDVSFMDSLDQMIQMNPDSITIYQLEMPLNTPLFRNFRKGVLGDSLANWDVKRARLAQGFARLEEAGYQLRSAYTAVRDSKRQQFVYQDAQYHGADLLGIGASAFSYVNETHYQNLTSLESYLQHIDEGQLPIERAYVLSEEERLIREFVLQLKLGKVNRTYFRRKFEVDIFERFHVPLAQFTSQGWLIRSDDELLLTREGLLRADRMLAAFYLPKHQDVRYS